MINLLGYAGTIRAVEDGQAEVLYDYQRPSSAPKPTPVAELHFVSGD